MHQIRIVSSDKQSGRNWMSRLLVIPTTTYVGLFPIYWVLYISTHFFVVLSGMIFLAVLQFSWLILTGPSDWLGAGSMKGIIISDKRGEMRVLQNAALIDDRRVGLKFLVIFHQLSSHTRSESSDRTPRQQFWLIDFPTVYHPLPARQASLPTFFYFFGVFFLCVRS